MNRKQILYLSLIVLINTYVECSSNVGDTCNLKWATEAETLLGTGTAGSGPRELYLPTGVFLERKTNILYITDRSNNRIQKLYSNGEVKTAAGEKQRKGNSSDTLYFPHHATADEYENVYVADTVNNRIQYWEKDAQIGQTVAGTGREGSQLDELNCPSKVFLDSNQNIIIGDSLNNRILRWPSIKSSDRSNISVMAGGNGAGLNTDQTYTPSSLIYDEASDTMFISNFNSHTVTKYTMGKYEHHSVYAGIPGRSGNTSVQLNRPGGIVMDSYGNLYVADEYNSRIQMFCPDAVFGKTIAGITGQNGNATHLLSYPSDIQLDQDLNLIIADTYNHRIQRFKRIQ